jgi:predicted kinase
MNDRHLNDRRPAPAVLVVVGASGAGKSTLTRGLAALGLPGVTCHHFDTLGVPTPEEIAARFGGGEVWQAWALDQWMQRLARNDDDTALAVLDAQVRPHAAVVALRQHNIARGRVVLVDCGYAERNARLRGARGQPELATADMDCFAAYMRGQADALDLPIIDTTGRPEETCLVELLRHTEGLLAS